MKDFPKILLYLFALSTGILLWAGWPANGFSYLLLIAFCPLLLVEEQLYLQRETKRPFAFFKYAYLATLTWNILTTWWVLNSTIVGGVAAIILNALFMAVVLTIFHWVRVRTNNITGYASLIILWISFEYMHLNWQCSWPWLTLGNGFANHVEAVQWYEFTGVLGGSVWILATNISVINLLRKFWLYPSEHTRKARRNTLLYVSATIIVPLIFLAIASEKYSLDHIFDQKNVFCKKKIVIVQPNIDPYNEKFTTYYMTQVRKMLALANTEVDSTTDYLVFPETALTSENIWENAWDADSSIIALKLYLKKHPRLSLVSGASTNRAYNKGDTIPESARQFGDGSGFYDSYNTAIEMDNNYPIQYYHKSKLVPGVETMPFRHLLGPIADLAFKLGGTSGTLGTQKEPSVFYSPNSKTTIGTAICYESIYGEYIGKYIQKGAQFIFIITNDGWWQDTPGYRQHLMYARLRAIETRRYIVRSANTGVSAVIDPSGTILQQTGWWVPAVIKASVLPYSYITFYAAHGDYIGRAACWLSAILAIYLLVNFFRKRRT